MVKSCMDRKMIFDAIQIVGHRGFSGIYPENTILAFKKAIELGVDFIELDVRQTRDGELVVLHDEKIDRTTDGTGFVSEMTFKEIRRYDAGKWKNFPGEKIPHLEEVFEILDSKTGLLIEIKKCDIERFVKTFEKYYRTMKKVFVGSFNLEYIESVRKLMPEVPVSLISSAVVENLRRLISCGVKKLDIEFHCLDRTIVKKFVASGFIVNAWTPDTQEDLLTVIQYYPQFITTNRPDILKTILSAC